MKWILFLCITTSLFCEAQTRIELIPQPAELKMGKGQHLVSSRTSFYVRDATDKTSVEIIRSTIQNLTGLKIPLVDVPDRNSIRVVTKTFIRAPDADAYELIINPERIEISGDTHAGTFHGLQTLAQLMLKSRLKAGSGNAISNITLPSLTILDRPRFGYRGMHLDVSRHFFTVDYVKEYIDFLAAHKLNYFHWHLTDDQGWRIEIMKYPDLVKVGSRRNGTIVGRYPGIGNDNLQHRGYYTQDEIRSVIEYAKDRFITVVPEIEMPGHASAAIAAYPWLSCFPSEKTVIPLHPSVASINSKGKVVQETWGVFDDVFHAGSDSTFIFLENVLDEVIALFPSKYIHIGGDECPKSSWKRCPSCQARMKKLNLKDEHELQSYFIQRIEKHVNSKGRTIIGWDEILEGGLAQNAVVMSWRGESGGIDAAKQDHFVIMTPQKPVYFDHSQSRNEDSTVIGGFNPLEQVYNYEPVPKMLDTAKAKYILGAQANLWTEYIGNTAKLEYMVFPRIAALSEVLWTSKNQKSWESFCNRLPMQLKMYKAWKINYSNAFYELNLTVQPAKNNSGLVISAVPRDNLGVIKYRSSLGHTSGTYSKPITVNSSTDLSFTYSRNGEIINAATLPLKVNLATGKKISVVQKPNERYPGTFGAFSLTNGMYSYKGLSSPDWLGFIGDDMEATIDLGSIRTIDSVRMHTLEQNGSWVYLPSSVEIQVSDNGKDFRPIGESSTFVNEFLTMGWITVRMLKTRAKYVKLIAKNSGTIPDGKPGAGNKAWLFADEIQVY